MDDLTHCLSNLEIETHSSSSSSRNEEKEEEMFRNWVELPAEVMSLIFLNLGYIDILGSVQWVCSSWWKLSKQPHLFRSIHVEKVSTLFGRRIDSMNATWGMVKEAIDRSSGQLVEFSVQAIANDGLLSYMSESCSSLKRIRLVSCHDLSDDGLLEIAINVPQLEELEIIHCSHFRKDVIETFGRFCPLLKSCRLNYVKYLSYGMFTGVPLAIAMNMPELRHLNLFGSRLTDDDLKAILDGCPHLESLDLRQCYGLEFAGNWKKNWKKKCGNIKVVRLPFDPTHDFEYQLLPYPFCDYLLCDSDDNEYDIYCGIDYDDDSYGYNEKIYGSDD